MEDQLHLLHRDATLRFAGLPRDLREYIAQMVLWPWRIICSSCGLLMLGNGPHRIINGRSIGNNMSAFTRMRSDYHILAWGESRLEFWGNVKYGGYNHSIPLLCQREITCASRQSGVQQYKTTALTDDKFTVCRPDIAESVIFNQHHEWNQLVYTIPNVPPEFIKIVLYRDHNPRYQLVEFVLWDCHRRVMRIVLQHSLQKNLVSASRCMYQLHRAPIGIGEAPTDDKLCLTYAWGIEEVEYTSLEVIME